MAHNVHEADHAQKSDNAVGKYKIIHRFLTFRRSMTPPAKKQSANTNPAMNAVIDTSAPRSPGKKN